MRNEATTLKVRPDPRGVVSSSAMNDEPPIKVPPELDAAIDAVFAYGKPKAKRRRGRQPLGSPERPAPAKPTKRS